MLLRLATIAAFLAPIAQAATKAYYDYDHPELWEAMADSACAGVKNSPVAVTDMDCTSYEDYVMENGDCTFADMDAMITENGVNMMYKADSTCRKATVKIPGIDELYTHYNVHIHMSSEHTIDGKFFAAEMHMVHLREDGQRAAVIGTMIEPDRVADNGVLDSFLDAWKDARNKVECGDCGKSTDINRGYDADDMHPYKMLETSAMFHYDGGLTTPPCSEIVWWNLADTPMSISVKQFAELSDIILKTKVDKNGECKPITVASKSGSTSRPVQALNGRVIQKICSTNHGTGGMVGKRDDPDANGSEDDDTTKDEDSSAISVNAGIGAISFAAFIAMGQIM